MNITEYMNKHSFESKDEALIYLAQIGYKKETEYIDNKEEIFEIIDNFSEEERNLFLKYYGAEINKNPKRFNESFNEGLWLAYIDLSSEEFEQLNVNPFSTQIKKYGITFLISCAFPLLFMILYTLLEMNFLKNASLVLLTVFSIVSTYLLFPLGRSIVRYFVFRKLKKQKSKQI